MANMYRTPPEGLEARFQPLSSFGRPGRWDLFRSRASRRQLEQEIKSIRKCSRAGCEKIEAAERNFKLCGGCRLACYCSRGKCSFAFESNFGCFSKQTGRHADFLRWHLHVALVAPLSSSERRPHSLTLASPNALLRLFRRTLFRQHAQSPSASSFSADCQKIAWKQGHRDTYCGKEEKARTKPISKVRR